MKAEHEAAKKLINTFYYQLANNGSIDKGQWSCTIRWEQAKICATMLCKEMIERKVDVQRYTTVQQLIADEF